jgi:glutaredoxin-related protein
MMTELTQAFDWMGAWKMDVLDDDATRDALRQLPGWERTPDALVKNLQL